MDEINKPLLFGFVGILIVLVGLPMVAQLAKSDGASPAGNGGGSYDAPVSTSTTSAPAASSAPTMTTRDLENTAWRVPTEQGDISVQLLPGGRAVATPPPALAGMVQQMTGKSTLDGTWTLSGNSLTMTASAMGQTQTINAEIVGDQIQYQGRAATRLQ